MGYKVIIADDEHDDGRKLEAALIQYLPKEKVILSRSKETP